MRGMPTLPGQESTGRDGDCEVWREHFTQRIVCFVLCPPAANIDMISELEVYVIVHVLQ